MTSLYIHIPFCEKKCFYCSFVVSVGQAQRIDAYLQALEQEAVGYKGQKVGTVYVGGGTPTFMNEPQLERLVSMIRNHFSCVGNREWTIEANPEGMTPLKAKKLKSLGFNRVSLGVQSFDNTFLKYLGRNHDSSKAKQAFFILREAGFANINIDLMFSYPQQTQKDLEKDVAEALILNSEHISLYSLTIEENSRFHIQKIQPLKEERQAELYRYVIKRLEGQGFKQYEVSNFAKPGQESQHNLHYWQGGEYIGLGIGAHSYLQSRRSWNVTRLMDYLDRMERGANPMDGFEELTTDEKLKERLLFGLRMNGGVNMSQLEERYRCRFPEETRTMISDFIREGFLDTEDEDIKATDKGRLVLDELCARLI